MLHENPYTNNAEIDKPHGRIHNGVQNSQVTRQTCILLARVRKQDNHDHDQPQSLVLASRTKSNRILDRHQAVSIDIGHPLKAACSRAPQGKKKRDPDHVTFKLEFSTKLGMARRVISFE